MTDLPPREVDRLETAIRELTGALDRHRLEMAATYVRQDVYRGDLAAIREDVKAHADWLLWAQRIIIGAVVLGLLGLVVAQGGAR